MEDDDDVGVESGDGVDIVGEVDERQSVVRAHRNSDGDLAKPTKLKIHWRGINLEPRDKSKREKT